MTDTDQGLPGRRFGAATPGARPEPPPLKTILTAEPPHGGRPVAKLRVLAAAGIIIVAVGGFLSGRYTGPSVPPIRTLAVTTVALPAGARLSRADMHMVSISPQPGQAVPTGTLGSAAVPGVLGLVTKTALPAGTFLQRSSLTPRGAVPGRSQALVGLALKPGQLPSTGLTAGQPVQIILLPTNAQGETLPPVPLTATTIWDEHGPDSSGSTQATVVVPAALATELASYAARGEVALVALPSSP